MTGPGEVAFGTQVLTGGAILAAFVLAVVGASAKWWAPWVGRKLGHAFAVGFETEITMTSRIEAVTVVKEYEARAVERERAQDEKISRMVDEVTIVHELALDAATKADVINARLDDLVHAVDALNTSGFNTLGEVLSKGATFQSSLLELLPTLGLARRTDITGIIPAAVAPAAHEPQETPE